MAYPHHDNYSFLTEAPVRRVVLVLAVPAVVSMLVTSLYNMADTYFVGRLSTQAVAAVGVAFAVMSVIQAVGFFFGHGSGNYVAQALGARRGAEAARMASAGLQLGVAGGAVLAVAGLLWLAPLVRLSGATPTVQPLAERYVGIVLLGAPFMTGAFTLSNQLRLQGHAFRAMLGILSGALLNVMLAPLFIFVFGWGVGGAAWATVVSQACAFGVLLWQARRPGSVRISLRPMRPAAEVFREIARGGTPSLLRQGLACAAVAVLNLAAASYGDAAIAAMSVVGRVSFFVYAAVIGLGQGFQPLCGFCYGAGRYGRVRAGFVFCVSAGTALLTGCAAVGWWCAEGIVALFRADPAVVAVGAEAFRWQILAWPLLAFTGVANQMLQTLRLAWRANLVAAARSGLFFLPLALVLPTAFGLRGVELIQPVSDVCAFLLALPVVLLTFRQMARR